MVASLTATSPHTFVCFPAKPTLEHKVRSLWAQSSALYQHTLYLHPLCRGQVLLDIVPGSLLDRCHCLRGALRLLVLQGSLEEELDLLGGQVQGGGTLEEAPDTRALSLLDVLQDARMV